MAGTGLQMFTALLLVQLFYALAVTLIVPTLPGISAYQVVAYTNSMGQTTISTAYAAVQGGVTNSQAIPLLAFGALIFYSAQIIINLMINFFTAIPQMITILFTTLFHLLPFANGAITTGFIAMFQVIVSIIYFIAVLTFLMSIVSGRSSSGGLA